MTSSRRWRAVGYAVIAALLVFIAGSIFYIVHVGAGTLPNAGQAPSFTADEVNTPNPVARPVSMHSLQGKNILITWYCTHCTDECPLTMSQVVKDIKTLVARENWL